MCQKYILLIITAQLYHPQRSGVVRTSQWWWRPTSNLGILWFGVAFVLHFFSCEISMSFQWWNHHASSSLSPRVHTNVLPLKMRTIILQDGNGDVYGRVVVSSCKYRHPLHRHLLAFCCSDTHQDWRHWTASSHLIHWFFAKGGGSGAPMTIFTGVAFYYEA